MTIWDESHECMSRDELEQLQLERLQATLNRAYRNVRFYKKTFDTMGFAPGDIDNLGALSRLPFTTRKDLASAYPYEMFAVPLKEVVRIHASSGTSENPSIVGYTANDLKHWGDLVARFLFAAGVTREDVVQVAFNYGLFTGAFGLTPLTPLSFVIDTEKFTNFPVEWSTIDRFKYLVDRYTKNPDLFPTLSAADFETIKKAFYNNQPIVLTLPF